MGGPGVQRIRAVSFDQSVFQLGYVSGFVVAVEMQLFKNPQLVL